MKELTGGDHIQWPPDNAVSLPDTCSGEMYEEAACTYLQCLMAKLAASLASLETSGSSTDIEAWPPPLPPWPRAALPRFLPRALRSLESWAATISVVSKLGLRNCHSLLAAIMKSPELFCLLAQVLKILVIRSSQKNPDFPKQSLQKEASKVVFLLLVSGTDLRSGCHHI